MSNPSKELLNRLESMILQEAYIQRKNIEKQWALPLHERIQKGKAIKGLCFSGHNKENGNLIFTCDENNSLFRSGDSLFFHKGSPLNGDYMECFLESDDERYIEVSAHSKYEEHLGKHPDKWIADEGYLDLSDLYLGALFDVAEKDIGRNRILPLLLGHLKSSVEVSEYMNEYQNAIQAGFNDSQVECAAQAMASDLAYLIQGPPGTGKTFVIAHITRTLVSAGERVFITSFTHRAINNVLNKIFDLDPDLPVCKIGINARADDLKVKNFPNFLETGLAEKEGGYAIWGYPLCNALLALVRRSFRHGNL